MTTQRRELRSIIQLILDEYGVLCTYQFETPLCDAIADAAIAKLKPKRKQRTPAQVESAERYHLAKAIAEVCVWGYEENNGRLLREAKMLAKATPTPTPALVRRHYGQGGAWYVHGRWGRGETGPPTPGQIRTTWAKLVGGTSDSDGMVEFVV